MHALHAALALIVITECVMAGPVLPAFTKNVTPGPKPEIRPRWEPATLALTAIALLSWVVAAPAAITAAAFGLAAAAHLRRRRSRQPGVTRRRPVLWPLHAACVWIPIGFILLALARIGWVGVAAGVHALGVGATGGRIIGMVTRTARGHTGRLLQAAKAEVAACLLVMAAAVLRVALPILARQWSAASLRAAAPAWSAAFALDLVIHTPWSMSTRLDGKAGRWRLRLSRHRRAVPPPAHRPTPEKVVSSLASPRIELRAIAPLDRQPLVFERIAALQAGEAVERVNDHGPVPPRLQFESRLPGRYEWTTLEAGPHLWRVRIASVSRAQAVAQAASREDACCSGGARCG